MAVATAADAEDAQHLRVIKPLQKPMYRFAQSLGRLARSSVRAVKKVLFARGTTWKSPWCEVKHRAMDWAARSSFTEEFEVVIMIEVVTGEMHGSDRVLT